MTEHDAKPKQTKPLKIWLISVFSRLIQTGKKLQWFMCWSNDG